MRDQATVKPGLKPPVDVCTPAGVAKMLIKDTNKLGSRDLREGRCHPVILLFIFPTCCHEVTSIFQVYQYPLHFSHILWQHGWSAKQADEGGPLYKEGSTKREGGASQPPQMVGQTKIYNFNLNPCEKIIIDIESNY